MYILKLSTLRLKNFDERYRIQTALAWDDVYRYILFILDTHRPQPSRSFYSVSRIPLYGARKLSATSSRLLLVSDILCASVFAGSENPRLGVTPTLPKADGEKFNIRPRRAGKYGLVSRLHGQLALIDARRDATNTRCLPRSADRI